ncbi:MAG: S-methyl-5-thioribose kinase [Lachnospiraceae bacterium]|nr:S-methyl-5-thioribose kinase [Lachnospiraceae bacterium]
MKSFDTFFLMDLEAAKRYAAEVLHFFDGEEELDAEEIGDGNINYVFRVFTKDRKKSVIIKQADKLLRSSGRPLDIGRNKIEAHMLMLEHKLAPGFVPVVYRYDETMAATSMEDVSAYSNMRKELLAGHVYDHIAENISTFLADTLLPMTDLVVDAEEKKKLVAFYTNPELCKITEDLVLTEPYYNYKNRNILTPGTESFVETEVYGNEALCYEAALLRERFMNYAQSLLHGDLHSGSIFINEHGLKVLDPEFAFYGPMGYDIGNVIGNLFFTWANLAITEKDSTEVCEKIAAQIEAICDLTKEKLSKKYDETVTLPLYKTEAFKTQYLGSVMEDSYGYAGTEVVRRTIGDSKVMEINKVTDPAQRIPMDKALIRMGTWLIMNRRKIRTGRELTEAFREILTGEEVQ